MTMTIGTGIEILVDYFASIPSPKRIYVRTPQLSLLEAMGIATNTEAMSKITYLDYVFHNCAVIAVSDENGTPKISASYETMERTGG